MQRGQVVNLDSSLAIAAAQLSRTRTPPDWHPGASLPLRSLWFGLGAPLLSAR